MPNTPNCSDERHPLLTSHRVSIQEDGGPRLLSLKYTPAAIAEEDRVTIEPTAGKQYANFVAEPLGNNVSNIPDGTVLSYEQATNLIATLENTKDVIRNYLYNLEQDGGRATPMPRRKSWWGLHCWPQKRKWLYRYITVVTVSLQFLNLLILSLLDAWPKPEKERPYIVASSVTMIILQLINLTFLMLASGRLVKQIYRNSVNSTFLAQTYGATILLFAGLYTLTYRLDRHSWRFVNENLNESPMQVFVLYAKFLFYSISTATLCDLREKARVCETGYPGVGFFIYVFFFFLSLLATTGSDNVLPEYWYNCLFAGFQMLLSFCYFASILGSAVCHDTGHSSPTALPTSISLQKPRPGSSISHHHLPQQQQRHHHHHPPPHHQHQQQQQPQRNICQCLSSKYSNSAQENFNIAPHHTTDPNERHFRCSGGTTLSPSTSCESNTQCCFSNLIQNSNYHTLPTNNKDHIAVSQTPTPEGEVNQSFPRIMAPRVIHLDNGSSGPLTAPDLEVAVVNAGQIQHDNTHPEQWNDLCSS